MKKVSIIIPVKEINDYIRESIPYILALDYRDYEVIILPDFDTGESFPKTRVIPTGAIGPAEKRDLAASHAEGEILAFLDDDAYPRADWLKNAVRHFDYPEIAAVGGPAVTPDHDSVWQRASGAVFSSWLTSGGYEYRYVPRQVREVDDYPTVNLLIRKDVFEEIGGFDTSYWPGEDTKLCLDVTKRLKKKIIYDPDAMVFHHRRPLFIPHLKQVSRYAFHRGYFAKVLPETSFRFSYFIPSLFLLWVVFGGVLSPLNDGVAFLYAGVMSLYGFLLFGAIVAVAFKEKDLKLGILTMPGIFLTHLAYGYNFIKGFMVRR